MRLNEFSSPLNKYLVTVKVHGTSVKTLIHAESQSQARLLLGKMFGKDNVQSVNSISTNESQTTISLNLQEAVSADDLVSLWQIVSQNVSFYLRNRHFALSEFTQPSSSFKSQAILKK